MKSVSKFFQGFRTNACAEQENQFLPARVFDVAVSIGQDCRARFHIDRVQRARHFRSYVPRSGFFDSLCRDKGHGCVADLISTDFALSAKEFELKEIDGEWRAYVPRHGLYFIHDFKFSAPDRLRRQAEMEEMRDQVIAKYSYQGDKFLKLLSSGQRILFVLSDGAQLTFETADALARSFRAVNRDFSFSILQIATKGVSQLEHPDVIGVEIDDTGTVWSGSDVGYDQAFKEVFIRA